MEIFFRRATNLAAIFAKPAKINLDDWKIGAGNEVRTRDLNLGKVALYQLSYSRTIGITNFCMP